MKIHDGGDTFPAHASSAAQVTFRHTLYCDGDTVYDLDLHATEIITPGANGIRPIFLLFRACYFGFHR
jgi:hypothetical protein